MDVCTVILQDGSYVVDASCAAIIREAAQRGEHSLRISVRCPSHEGTHCVDIRLDDVVSVIRHGMSKAIAPDNVVVLYR